MKKVYICTPFENKMAQRGTRTLKIAEMILDAGYRVEFVTTNFGHNIRDYFSEELIEESRKVVPYRLIVLNVFGYRKNISIGRVLTHIYLSIKFFLYLQCRVKKGDVVYVPSRPPELYCMAAMLGRSKKVRTIVDITDVWPDALVNTSRLKYSVFKSYCDLFNSYALKRIDRFIHSAPSFLNWLRRYAPHAESELIPLGYDVDRWSERPALRKKGLSGSLKLVYVGQLSHQFCIGPVIEAVANDKRYELHVIGDGEYFDKWQELAKGLNMRNIRFTGFISHKEVAEELYSKNVGIVPMISSSLPNKLFDYIAASLPIIVLGRNDSADFVLEHEIGWEQSFDVHSLKRFFGTLTKDDVYKKTQNILHIRWKFSKDTLYERFVDLVRT